MSHGMSQNPRVARGERPLGAVISMLFSQSERGVVFATSR